MTEDKKKWVDWEQPGDPDWVETYLKAVRSGKTNKAAAMIANVHIATTVLWRKKSYKNSQRHIQAKNEARERAAIWVDDVLKTQAEKGSAWHLSRRAVHLDYKLWKEINDKLRSAEPDVQRQELSNSGTPQYEVVIMEDIEEPTFDDTDDEKEG